MTLQATLDAFRADFKAGKPPYNAPAHIHPIMERATAELIASGAAQRALKVGDKAPLFSLKDANGNAVSSARLLAQGPLVLTFYRGVWCPYCTLELQALQAFLPTLTAAGAQLLALSPQTAANSRKSTRIAALGFPILSDTHNDVADAFGLRFQLPDYLIELYKALGNNLPLINDDPAWTLPMPARYVIGQDSVIRYAEVNPDYTQRPEPSALLDALTR